MNEVALGIAESHVRDVLVPRGLDPKKIGRLGVYSVTTPEELPEEFREHKYAAVPALVFPWRSPSGSTVLQLRPDVPKKNDQGDDVKYVFPTGSEMILNKLREPSRANDGPVLICEGTMQSHAAAIYAPDSVAVYGMSGCWNWRKGDTTVATPDLMIAEGREVFVCLDADAASNRNVFDAGVALRSALMNEGARSVKFLRLDGHGKKAGLDDVLGSRPTDKRATYVARLIQNAADKPADARPAARRSSDKGALSANRVAGATGDRPFIAINDDRHDVINRMTETLINRWDSTELFDFGGVLTRLRIQAGSEPTLEPVTDGIFADLISEAAVCVAVNGRGEESYAWPDEPSRKAVLSSRVSRFTKLDRMSRVPFVRPDGSIAQRSGYDEETATFLVLDDAAEAIAVPDEPSADDVRSAVKLLREEWLGDLMDIMPEPADQANALGLMLTPLIRGLVPLAPLAVVDGLQMGVGKNLISDCLAIFATGRQGNPLPYSSEDEENRKVITSSFRAGHELFVFDEAHAIEGRNLARAITALTYSDRVLGVSNMAEFPNRITWVALGNNVNVNGDLARRVYRIRLAPRMVNPQDRNADEFRHPDLKGWTLVHRAELLAAGLTLVRAWFAAGSPQNAAGRRFGSFESWGGMVGGILDVAGVPGFLENLTEWRSETDYETGYWTDHFGWLYKQFGTDEFTVADVVGKMSHARSGSVEHPPRITDHTVSGYNRLLGQAYGRVKNRTFGGVQLVQAFRSAGHGVRWQLVDRDELAEEHRAENSAAAAEASEGQYGTPKKQTVSKPSRRTPASSASSATSHIPTPDAKRPEDSRVNATSTAIRNYPNYPNYPTDLGREAETMSHLVSLAVPASVRECPDCELPEELVPGEHWYACPRCHPATFTRT